MQLQSSTPLRLVGVLRHIGFNSSCSSSTQGICSLQQATASVQRKCRHGNAAADEQLCRSRLEQACSCTCSSSKCQCSNSTRVCNSSFDTHSSSSSSSSSSNSSKSGINSHQHHLQEQWIPQCSIPPEEWGQYTASSSTSSTSSSRWHLQHQPSLLLPPQSHLSRQQIPTNIQQGWPLSWSQAAAFTSISSRKAVASPGSPARWQQHTFQKDQVLGGGRYKLVNGMNTVFSPVSGKVVGLWQAQDLRSNQPVLLKCMEAGDTASYSAGMREAAIHAALGRCPNILGMTDAFEHRTSSGRHPVTVWRPAGSTLAKVARQYGSWLGSGMSKKDGHRRMGICDNPLTLKRLARDILTGLDYLHRRGVVHGNVCLDTAVLDRKFVRSTELMAHVPWSTYDRVQHIMMYRWAQLSLENRLKPFNEWVNASKKTSERLVNQAHLEGVHCEVSMHKATFMLQDLSHAVAYRGTLPYCPGPVSGQAEVLQQVQLYNANGTAAQQDPAYQAPEEILGMPYLTPSYDMWRFGCMMFEAATNTKLFTKRRKDRVLLHREDPGFGDQHYFLDSMVEVLGFAPRGFGRSAPRRWEFFFQAEGLESVYSHYNPNVEQLAIHAGPLLEHPEERSPYKELPERTVLHLAGAIDTRANHGAVITPEAKPFADFLLEVLRWDPTKRQTAAQMLQHPWLQDFDSWEPVMMVPLTDGYEEEEEGASSDDD